MREINIRTTLRAFLIEEFSLQYTEDRVRGKKSVSVLVIANYFTRFDVKVETCRIINRTQILLDDRCV